MSDTSKGIRIVAAIGSVRPGNQTAKALALVVDEMRKHEGIEVEVIDPAEVAMPLGNRERSGCHAVASSKGHGRDGRGFGDA